MGEEVGAPPCTSTSAFQLLFCQKRWHTRREGLYLAEFPIAVPSKEPFEMSSGIWAALLGPWGCIISEHFRVWKRGLDSSFLFWRKDYLSSIMGERPSHGT